MWVSAFVSLRKISLSILYLFIDYSRACGLISINFCIFQSSSFYNVQFYITIFRKGCFYHFSFFFKFIRLGCKMAQWLKYLPPKSKNRCSDPQNSCKKARHSSTCMQCVHMCANPALPWGTGRQKPHNVWKLEGQPASGNKRPRFKQHGSQD